MGPDRDRTRDPWICSQTRIRSQTRYRLRYVARTLKALAHKLVCAFFVLLCDKYQICTCLLNYFFNLWKHMSLYGSACSHINIKASRPLSVHQRNAISMAFRWWADSGPRLYADWDTAEIVDGISTQQGAIFNWFCHWLEAQS